MSFFIRLTEAQIGVEARIHNNTLTLEKALDALREEIRETTALGNKVFIIGNGGSAAIASHIAIDWSKFLKANARALNDTPMMTMIANDLDFTEIFKWQIKADYKRGDMLVAISSSGRSQNILKAANYAKAHGMTVVTLSGFKSDNELRHIGKYSFWVPSEKYGITEITHLSLLHSICDV